VRKIISRPFQLVKGNFEIGGRSFLQLSGTTTLQAVYAVPAIAPEHMEEALFVAKSCTTCHAHDGLTMTTTHSLRIGRDLTCYQANPDFLRRWLANPKNIRPGTIMPDLELTDQEIEVLVSFFGHNN
jgi:hypothetical protein